MLPQKHSSSTLRDVGDKERKGLRREEEKIKRGNPWLYDETQLAMAHSMEEKSPLNPRKVVLNQTASTFM